MNMRALRAGHPIIPVIVIDEADAARDLVAALAEGGILIAEITLRTPAGLEAIRRSADNGTVTVGAGTVLSVDELDRVVDAGVRFLVSPGLDEQIVARASELGVGVLPGVATATEVQHAVRLGLDLVKFFPADRLGGLGTIAALSAPFVDMGFVPSGGVGPDNAADYLTHPAVPAVSGSWMVQRHLIRERAFDQIAHNCRAAMTELA
jgi:2-dehydro-3-deoxyphosphogluconate aldolase/(4S)-4-hydroxy-2-oxoglutarate aldolase